MANAMNDQGERGSLTAGELFDRAVKVAGVLAECGVQKVTISGTELSTRTVDLPSLLVPGVIITCNNTAISIFADRIDWTTASIELAAALRAASGR